MKEIKLRELDYYYINLAEHKDRSAGLLGRLNKVKIPSGRVTRVLGIRKEGIPQDSVYIGCFNSQLKALKLAVKRNKPFVILEDDAMINRFPDTIEIPDDAHSVYLGLSDWALNPQSKVNLASYKGLIYDNINSEIAQVYNMLSSHAIAYFDMDYVNLLIGILDKNLNEGSMIASASQKIPMSYYGGTTLPCDVIMANSQYTSKVYALRDPIFYQDEKHEYCTLIKL